MFNKILVAVSLITTTTLAQTTKPEIKKIYEQHTQRKDNFFKTDLTKKNLKPKVTDLLKKMNQDFDAIKKIELKQSKTEITPESLQMALDMTLLEPLEQLAKSKYSKQDCKEATHLNELYESSEEDKPDNRTKPVEAVIKKICK